MEKSKQKKFDEDFEEGEKTVRMITKTFSPNLKSNRQTIISEIVECLKETSLNIKPLKGVLKVQLKKISFNETVTVYPLIKPQYTYFAKRKQELQLSDNQPPVLKTFRSISGIHFCSCNKCRVQMSECGSDRCGFCYG